MTYRSSARNGTTDHVSMTSMASTPLHPTKQVAAHAPPPPIPTETSPPGRYHSKSMPTTPSHLAQPNPNQQRSPSLGRSLHNASPRSVHSDSSQTPSAARKAQAGCKYETAMARARRRVPYSLGTEKLGPDPHKSRKRLAAEEEERLSTDMGELFDQLLPSQQSEDRRRRLVEKLEKLLQNRWPEASIKVNVFGSTGNNLGTTDADVDICITTDCKELLRVCSIAELLANNGMERVVCVSSAKVPIVKVWDPELQVACDLNVNNPIALENTAMIRIYGEIDPRVRPLAMIIKHWAKRRILNDAALGGTLSSYTWICLTLNFFQTRQPPVIPSLQQQPGLGPRTLDGVNVAFDKDLEKYKDFGSANKSSLGELLYQFFRYYSFEFEFEEKVVSVRLGSLLSKSEKGWHRLQDNRLCVEEPFNTSRNLANTADDTSMKGIHLELRRAFALVAEGRLDKCCEAYVYPPDEPKLSEHFVPPTARPVIPQPPQSVRGGKYSGRGGRNAPQMHRNNLAGRRASNPANRTQSPMMLRNLPFQMTTQELQLQAQHQQHLLHDQLFQQFQYLQLQEQELRARLNLQRQRSMLSQATTAGYSFAQTQSQDENVETSSASGMSSRSRAPLSAPLYQHRFLQSPYLGSTLPVTGIVTNPSSPHLSAVIPDNRRLPRRMSAAQSQGGGSLRAHSQPARSFPAHVAFGHLQPGVDVNDYLAGRRSSASSNSHEATTGYSSAALASPIRRPAEYVGYYLGDPASQLGYPNSTSVSPSPSQVGLAIQNGGLSPRLPPRSLALSQNGAIAVGGRPESVNDTIECNEATDLVEPSKLSDVPSAPSPKKGPLIVDGSISSPPRRRRDQDPARVEIDEQLTFSTSTSEDLAFDTPSSSDEHSHDPREVDAPVSFTTGHASKLSNSEPPAVMNGRPESVSTSKPMTNGTGLSHDHTSLEQTLKPTLLPWTLGRQLSAVQEVRTPSPSLDRSNGVLVSPTSATFLQNQPKAKKTDSKQSSPNVGTLSPRPNGVPTSPVVTEGGTTMQSSWQMPKKKKNRKKTVKSENDANGINDFGGDCMPLEESERKGG